MQVDYVLYVVTYQITIANFIRYASEQAWQLGTILTSELIPEARGKAGYNKMCVALAYQGAGEPGNCRDRGLNREEGEHCL